MRLSDIPRCSRRIQWRFYLAALLFIIVAMVQRYLMQFRHLDPWKGGGFGMFSAISARNLRQLTVTLVTADGKEHRFPPSATVSRIPLDGDMRWQRNELIAMPRAAQLKRLANRLAESQWVAVEVRRRQSPTSLGEGRNVIPTQVHEYYYRMRQDVAPNEETQLLDVREVRVEVWEYDLNDSGNTLFLTKLADAVASHE